MKKTSHRLQALLYAVGEHDHWPTLAVATPLQRAGFLRWDGWIRGIAPDAKCQQGNRGWSITPAGRELLHIWVSA